MNKRLKNALLYGMLPLLILIFVAVAGLTTQEKTKLNFVDFVGVKLREINEVALADDWDDERQMAFMESSEFEAGRDMLHLTLATPSPSTVLIVQLNDDWEEVTETTFDLKGGQETLLIPLSPDTIFFRLFVSDEETELTHGRLVKDLRFHVKIALFWALGLFGVYALLLCWRFTAKKPEYGFLIAAVCIMAVLFVWVSPMEGIVWDGAIHRAKTEQLAFIGTESTVSSVLTSITFSDLGYVPGAIGMRIGMLFTEDTDMLLWFARVANAMTYIAACFFAVKLAARYKMIFAISALMPTAMFLGGSCSYDLIVNGFMYLFFSLLITQMLTPNKKLAAGHTIALTAALIMACAPKAIYVPIALFLLFLPKSKFASEKQRIAFNATVVLLFAAIAATFVLPMLLDANSFSDDRGGAVNAGVQLASILGNPIGYAGYLLNSIGHTFGRWLYYMSCNFGFYGLASPGLALCLMGLLLFTGLTDAHGISDNTAKIKLWHKGILALCSAAIIVLIYTSMFIAFTEVGAPIIAGVQARYFLPLLPMLLVLLQPAFMAKRKPGEWYPSSVLAAAVVLNFVMVATVLIG